MIALRLRLLPFLRRATRRWAVFKARSAVRYQPGEKMRVPFDRVANASMPRSIPVSCPMGGKDRTGTSAQEKQTYHPSASRLIVTVLGVPSNGRDQRRAILPILDRTRKPLSSAAPLPNCLYVNEV